MDLVLTQDKFVNNKLYVSYGTRQQAMFTIIDEEFPGTSSLGRVNVVTCMTRKLDTAGAVISASLTTIVIGIGDGKVGARSDFDELRGKLVNKDNMESCTIRLYED